MYASYVEVKMRPGVSAEAIKLARSLIPEVGQIPNIKQFTLVDKGNDKLLLIALYDSPEEQEAAGPKALDVIGKMEHLFATPPQRIQMEVPINHTYLKSPAGG